MKKFCLYFFLLGGKALFSQQTANYIQYNFNRAVLNPASSGTSPNQKEYYCFGMQRQWYDMTNAPKQTFANFSYTFRAPRSYTYWQNIGGTIESDQSGIFSNNSFYLNYTIHLALNHGMVASFGIHAGFRKFFLSQGIIDPRDPVNATAYMQAYAYPDIIPGFRLAGKRTFFEIAARQVSVIRQKDYFGPNAIASGSSLRPTLYVSAGTIFGVSDHWNGMSSIAAHWNVLGLNPSFDPMVLFFYDRRFGLGLATRNVNLLAAIVQFRLLKYISVGLSYAYTTNRARIMAPNTYEIMIGMTPMGLAEKISGRHSLAKCPILDF